MKKGILIVVAALFSIVDLAAQEYAVITSVESIVPAGLGRSRIIYNKTDMDPAQFTTERIQGTDSKMNAVKRRDLKVDNFEETKLLNFFSLGGINFQNIASNDALISGKLTEMAAAGWELAFVVSGVESHAGEPDTEGIFVTRYIFKR
jgi:hypothetical protein